MNVAEKLHGSPDYPRPCVALYELMAEAVEAFPEAGTDEEVNGGDAVEWLMPWIIRARKALKLEGVATQLPRPRLSAPGSSLEDFQNDLANLECAMRLAGLARDVEHGECDGTAEEFAVLERWIGGVLNDGAGSYEAGALVSWLGERKAETENTIAALDGTGMPEPDKQ